MFPSNQKPSHTLVPYRISPHPGYIFYTYQTRNGGDTDVKKEDFKGSACGIVGTVFGGKDH